MTITSERIRHALTLYERQGRNPGERIEWSAYTDEEMEQVAILADRYGLVGLLNRVRRARARRDNRACVATGFEVCPTCWTWESQPEDDPRATESASNPPVAPRAAARQEP